MYKYGHGNDDLINVAGEIEFVDTFLRGSTDWEQAKQQLEVLYGRERRLKECNEYISKGVVSQNHAMMLTQLVLRNRLIVQRCCFIAKSRDSGVADETISEQVDLYDDQIMDYTMDIVRRILDEANYYGTNENGTYDIFGFSKDIGLYQTIYSEYSILNNPEQRENAKEKVFLYRKFNSKGSE